SQPRRSAGQPRAPDPQRQSGRRPRDGAARRGRARARLRPRRTRPRAAGAAAAQAAPESRALLNASRRSPDQVAVRYLLLAYAPRSTTNAKITMKISKPFTP